VTSQSESDWLIIRHTIWWTECHQHINRIHTKNVTINIGQNQSSPTSKLNWCLSKSWPIKLSNLHNESTINCVPRVTDGWHTLHRKKSDSPILTVFIPCIFTELNCSLMTLTNAPFLYINTIKHRSYVFRRDSSSARQEILCILWSPKVRSRVHNSSPYVSITSLINSVHVPIIRLEDRFNIILPSISTSSKSFHSL
jgi:hypothetical protein